MVKIIYFSRHGKRIDRRGAHEPWKFWIKNSERWFDPPIVEFNISELELQAKTIAKLEAVYSSPFLRCIQTAHVYASYHQCPLYVEYGIGENLRQGWFERGCPNYPFAPDFPNCLIDPKELKFTYYTVESKYKSLYKNYKFPETRRQCRKRVNWLCQELVNNCKYESIMLVGHGVSTKDARSFFGLSGGFPDMGVLSSVKL